MNDPALGANSQARVRAGDLGATVAEIADELKSFARTRIQIVRSEFHEGIGAMRIALPLAAIALGLLAIAGLLFTAAMVVLVASAFAGNPYAWFYGFGIVGGIWTFFAVMAALSAYNRFHHVFPKKTIEVIKADKLWLQSEARSEL